MKLATIIAGTPMTNGVKARYSREARACRASIPARDLALMERQAGPTEKDAAELISKVQLAVLLGLLPGADARGASAAAFAHQAHTTGRRVGLWRPSTP